MLCTSFRFTDTYRIGFNSEMLVTTHRISGRQQIASSIFRAADGVAIEYDIRSTFASGLVKTRKLAREDHPLVWGARSRD